MPRYLLATRFALLGILAFPAPAAFALAIEDITGVWVVRSAYVFGREIGTDDIVEEETFLRKRLTIAISNGVPLCLFQWGHADPVAIAIEQWESQGADQATVRITQLAPSSEVVTYTVDRTHAREIRLTATSGSNAGKAVSLAKPTPRSRPVPAGPGAAQGQDAVAGSQPQTAAKAAASGLIARLTTDLNLERKKLVVAQANLRNQLNHSEGAAGGRGAEYDAVVNERKAAVRLHQTRIEKICEKLEELGVETYSKDKERTWKR